LRLTDLSHTHPFHAIYALAAADGKGMVVEASAPAQTVLATALTLVGKALPLLARNPNNPNNPDKTGWGGAPSCPTPSSALSGSEIFTLRKPALLVFVVGNPAAVKACELALIAHFFALEVRPVRLSLIACLFLLITSRDPHPRDADLFRTRSAWTSACRASVRAV
jgi:hypothetical protein